MRRGARDVCGASCERLHATIHASRKNAVADLSLTAVLERRPKSATAFDVLVTFLCRVGCASRPRLCDRAPDSRELLDSLGRRYSRRVQMPRSAVKPSK